MEFPDKNEVRNTPNDLLIKQDILDDPFDYQNIFYHLLQNKGYPISFKLVDEQGGLMSVHFQHMFTNSKATNDKVQKIHSLVQNSGVPLLITLVGHGSVPVAVRLLNGEKLTEIFNRSFGQEEGKIANPNVTQEDIEGVFMRTYERRIEVNGESEYTGGDKGRARYQYLKDKGAKPVSAERLAELMEEVVEDTLIRHPELKP